MGELTFTKPVFITSNRQNKKMSSDTYIGELVLQLVLDEHKAIPVTRVLYPMNSFFSYGEEQEVILQTNPIHNFLNPLVYT